MIISEIMIKIIDQGIYEKFENYTLDNLFSSS